MGSDYHKMIDIYFNTSCIDEFVSRAKMCVFDCIYTEGQLRGHWGIILACYEDEDR